MGLSPPNLPSGERSRGPPALERKLSAPLTPRAGSLTAGKAGCLPLVLRGETQPLFPAAARKSPGPGPPRGPRSLQISRSGNFPCAVFQAGRASRTKGRGRQRQSSLFSLYPTPHGGKGDPVNRGCSPDVGTEETQRTKTIFPGKRSREEPSPDRCGALPSLPALPCTTRPRKLTYPGLGNPRAICGERPGSESNAAEDTVARQ